MDVNEQAVKKDKNVSRYTAIYITNYFKRIVELPIQSKTFQKLGDSRIKINNL